MSKSKRAQTHPVRILVDERCVKRVASTEAALSHIADASGVPKDALLHELRHGRSFVDDAQRSWHIDNTLERL